MGIAKAKGDNVLNDPELNELLLETLSINEVPEIVETLQDIVLFPDGTVIVGKLTVAGSTGYKIRS